MADKRERTAEGNPATFRSVIKLAPAIGDWTTLRPIRTPAKKIKTGLYGFDRLSLEELKIAQKIHYNFGQSFLASIKKNLAVGGEMFSISSEQSIYSEFLKKVYQPTVYSKISIANFDENIIVCIDMPTANTVINHALGGRDIAPMTRKLTDIEEGVIAKAFASEMEHYAAAFEKIFEAPSFEVFNSPEIMIEPSIGPTSSFVFFCLELSLGDNPPGTITIGYSSQSLRLLLEKVVKRRSTRSLSFSKLSPSLLDGLTIPVIANLGDTAVPMQEIHGLEVGDIVSLDTSLGGFIDVYLGGFVKVPGRAGTRGEKHAVRVFSSQASTTFQKEMPTLKEEEEPSRTEDEMDINVPDLPLEKTEEKEYPVLEEDILSDELLEEEEEDKNLS